MTIPDIGHCAGSGSEPVDASIQTAESLSTGVCPTCWGRFELSPSGSMPFHDAAPIDQREVHDDRLVLGEQSDLDLGVEEHSRGFTSPPESPGPALEELEMSNYERDDSVAEDVREGADELGDAARRGADEAEEGTKSLTDRVTDAVEDVIPGDSDRDGH